MSIRFACEECRRVYDLPDESAGRQAKCECGEMLVVPARSTYTGRLREHAPARAEPAPSTTPPAKAPVKSPALFEEPLHFEPPPAPEPTPPPRLAPPASPAEPPESTAEPLAPPPLPAGAFAAAPEAAAPKAPAAPSIPAFPSVAASAPSEPTPKKSKYRNLRLYCAYLRWLAIFTVIGGVLVFFAQAFFLAVLLQEAPLITGLPALFSMLVTVGVTLGAYVLLNASAEFLQLAMDIEENTRGDGS